MSNHPFTWLYREGDHRQNLTHAAALLRMACEIDPDEIGSGKISELSTVN